MPFFQSPVESSIGQGKYYFRCHCHQIYIYNNSRMCPIRSVIFKTSLVEYGFSHSGSQNKFVNIRGASLLTATYAFGTQLCWDKCWDPNFFWMKWKIWMSPNIQGWVEYDFSHSGSQNKFVNIGGASLFTAVYELGSQLC